MFIYIFKTTDRRSNESLECFEWSYIQSAIPIKKDKNILLTIISSSESGTVDSKRNILTKNWATRSNQKSLCSSRFMSITLHFLLQKILCQGREENQLNFYFELILHLTLYRSVNISFHFSTAFILVILKGYR